MKRSNDRILTTHVGSLVRPREIRDAMRGQSSESRVANEAFAAVLQDSVGEVVRRQAEAGIDIISDGEYGKLGWARYVLDRLSGLEPRRAGGTMVFGTPETRERFSGFFAALAPVQAYDWEAPPPGERPSLPATHPTVSGGWDCVGPVTYKGQPELKRDIANFKLALENVQVEEAFMPAVAPMSVIEFQPPGTKSYYPTEDDYLQAVSDALAEEYKAIVDAGFLLQVDDSLFPQVFSRELTRLDAAGIRKLADRCVEALNYALTGIPEEKVRYHICWASNFGPHTDDAPLRDMVDIMLKVNAGAYSIEAANSRHEHEWMVWQDVKLPEGKILIPGLVTHHTMIVEHPELIAWRIRNFASLVGRENVIASTDCGFAQSATTVRVHPDIQWAKLEALAEGAAIATRQLWG